MEPRPAPVPRIGNMCGSRTHSLLSHGAPPAGSLGTGADDARRADVGVRMRAGRLEDASLVTLFIAPGRGTTSHQNEVLLKWFQDRGGELRC